MTATLTLAGGLTGTTLLQGALRHAVERFPTVFAGIDVPADPGRFKKALPTLIVPFEARRASRPERVDVARAMVDWAEAQVRFGDQLLSERVPADPGPATERPGTAPVGFVPSVRYRDRDWTGPALAELADRLRDDAQLTAPAAEALRWVAQQRFDRPLDLTGETFVLLGAAAELAPTHALLQAGARVVWVDRQAPDLDPSTYAGTLVHDPAAADLLTDLPAILDRVAAESPCHLGLFAYAPGKGREVLLTAAMNAVAARSTPRSITMWVSPTTPGEVPAEDRADRVRRRALAPRWQRLLSRLRALPEPSFHADGDVQIAHAIVPLQGPTYLAAQYLGKMLPAEVWAVDRDLRVSANVAGITHTKSLEHPLFLAGFRGAPTFGVEIFQPDQTRALATALMVHDLFRPDAPGADRTGGPAAQARRLSTQSIHGGVRSMPFVFDHTIRVAAMVGLGKQPSLVLKLRG